jgi:hypothetical protein
VTLTERETMPEQGFHAQNLEQVNRTLCLKNAAALVELYIHAVCDSLPTAFVAIRTLRP